MVHRGAAVVPRQVPAIFSVDDKDPAAHSITAIGVDSFLMSGGLIAKAVCNTATWKAVWMMGISSEFYKETSLSHTNLQI